MWKTTRAGFIERHLPSLPTPRPTKSNWFYSRAYHLLRVILGGLFIYAGCIKLLDPKAFAHSLAQFDLLPEPLLPLVAVGLPALELLAGVGLIAEIRGSLPTIAALLGTFLLVLGYAIWMELDVDCGCFTVDELNAQTGVKQAFFRDLAMAAVVLLLFWRRRVRANPPVSEAGENN